MRRTLVSLAAAATLVLGLSGPASAQWERFPDPVNDSSSTLEIDQVTVAYNDARAKVTVHFTHLTRTDRGHVIAYFNHARRAFGEVGIHVSLSTGRGHFLTGYAEHGCRRSTIQLDAAANSVSAQIPSACLRGDPTLTAQAGIEGSGGEDWMDWSAPVAR